MSLERIIKILEGFGFERIEAEVYVYLAKKGPQKEMDLSDALKIRKRQLYFILKKLQAKGVVSVSPEHPAVFSALPFEKTLNRLVKANIEQAKAIREIMEKL